MQDYLISVLLGVIEGLTEFLPVSSTAHLRLAERYLGLSLDDPYWKTYTVVIQLGAIIAVVVYFRNRLAELIRSFPRGKDGNLTMFTHPITLVLVATAVTIGPCYLLDKKIGENLEKLTFIGAALLIGGILMWVIDRVFSRPKLFAVEQIGFGRAIFVGLAQVLSAAFPGTSRSMVTIAAGQVVGMSRSTALEYSFLLSIPIMFAATGFKLLQTVVGKKGFEKQPLVMDAHRWGVLLVGLLVSFVVAWAVIAWFMAWVRRRGFTPFAIYRILLGAAVLYAALQLGLK